MKVSGYVPKRDVGGSVKDPETRSSFYRVEKCNCCSG